MSKLFPINKITVKQRARQLDQDHIDDLKKSIHEEGLLQPIVLVFQSEGARLVAGEHRLESYRQLNAEHPYLYEEIHAISLEEHLREQGKLAEDETLKERDLLRYEIEENVKRLQMNWQDKVLATAKYHRLSTNAATESGDSWTQAQTGELMGIAQAHVSRVLVVAKRLNASLDDPLWQCASLTDALRELLKEKQEVVVKEQMKRMRARQQQVKNKVPTDVAKKVADSQVHVEDFDEPLEDSETIEEVYSKEDLLELYYHGDAIEMLPVIAEMQTIHHIITDPPYGIDMDNLDMKNLQDVVDTHQVEPNIALLLKLLEVAYQVIDEKGFMCMWYDLDHHNLLQNHAMKVGWKVCRWPFVWAKSSPCMNQAAAYNFTKSTEVCMILRRSGNAVLKKKQPDNYIVMPNQNDTAHPFHKPRALWQRLIEAVSLEGQTIVDPFAGSGSLMAAGLTCNRDVLGVEIDEKHIHTGVNYLHDAMNDSLNFIDNVI